MLQLVLSGVAMGSIYALVALGFVLLYNATNVINFAQGELVALGAYLCVFAAAALGLSYLPGLGAALVAMAVIAPVLFFLAFYPLRDRSLLVGVVGTIGIGIALKNLLLLIAGPLRDTGHGASPHAEGIHRHSGGRLRQHSGRDRRGHVRRRARHADGSLPFQHLPGRVHLPRLHPRHHAAADRLLRRAGRCPR